MIHSKPDRCPTHPGELLREDILPALGYSSAKLAYHLNTHEQVADGIIRGNKPMTADFAVRLGIFLDSDPEFWLRMQDAYDIWHARQDMDVSSIPNPATRPQIESAKRQVG